VSAQVVTYECETLPISFGWQQSAIWCNPESWIDAGLFIQLVEIGECHPPPFGDFESFYSLLNPFEGVERFFVEWRVYADGSSSEIPGVAPSAFVLSNFSGVGYHVTISRDRVQLLRDVLLPIIFVDIMPESPHVHRIELIGEESYAYYIDAELIDNGKPQGGFLTSAARLTWSAGTWYQSNVVTWDYIRYGRIPDDHSGDFDTSGTVGLFDFRYFDECRANSGPNVNAGPGCRWADMDADTDVDLLDFGAFQIAFTGE